MVDSNTVPPILSNIGVKQASSSFNAKCRVFLLILLCVLIWFTVRSKNDVVTLDDISDLIKPDTIMHHAIAEMDEETQKNFLTTFRQSLNKDPTIFQTYFTGMIVSLVAGIASEYIVNGNAQKPTGIISKTILYSAFSTMITFIK